MNTKEKYPMPENSYTFGQRVIMGKDRMGTVTEVRKNDRCFPVAVRFDDSDYDVLVIYNQVRPA